MSQFPCNGRYPIETAGYVPIIQAWDFRPGENFVLRMQQAAAEANITIAVLSEAYLKAEFTRKVYNRAADVLRLSPQSLTHSKTALGAKYRHLRARLGASTAIVAMAHHLARLVYRMLRYGQSYVEKGIHEYELKFRLQRIKWLRKRSQIT